MNAEVPSFRVEFEPSEVDAFLREARGVLEPGRLTLGSRAERLEREFAAIAGTRHCVVVNSGSTALEVIYRVDGRLWSDRARADQYELRDGCGGLYAGVFGSLAEDTYDLRLKGGGPRSPRLTVDVVAGAVTEVTLLPAAVVRNHPRP